MSRSRSASRLAGAHAPGRARRRCGWGSCSSAGTPMRSSTSRRWPRASRWRPQQGAQHRLPAGADALPLLRDHARWPGGARGRARAARGRPDDQRSRAGPRPSSGVYVHASLFEQADRGDGLGFNTAILVSPDGELVQRTRKLHIPITAGYYEDKYFRQGPASGEGDPFPVVRWSRERLFGAAGGDPSRAARPSDLLGSVVPGAGARLLAGGRRGADLPDGDRLGARPPRASTPSRCGSR